MHSSFIQNALNIYAAMASVLNWLHVDIHSGIKRLLSLVYRLLQCNHNKLTAHCAHWHTLTVYEWEVHVDHCGCQLMFACPFSFVSFCEGWRIPHLMGMLHNRLTHSTLSENLSHCLHKPWWSFWFNGFLQQSSASYSCCCGNTRD